MTPLPSLHRKTAVVLCGLAILLAAARLRSYSEPKEWDIGTYSVIAHELLAGKHLYADIWDIKPPAIFVTFAAAQTIAGNDFAPVYLLSVLAAVVTMLGVYKAASIAGIEAGLWAALFWCLLCYEPNIGGNLPNTEVFINAAVAWAFALWLRASADRKRWLLIGALFALGSLYKHVALAPAACLGAFDLLRPPPSTTRRTVLVRLTTIAVVIAAFWGAVFLYFAATGRVWIIWETLVIYPRAYAGSLAANLATSLAPSHLFNPILRFAMPTLIIALFGAILDRRHATPWRYLLALAIGTQLAVALPGGFADHYYQLWFVPLAIAAGWGAAAIVREIKSPRLARLALSLAAFTVALPQLPWYTLASNEWAFHKHSVFFRWSYDAMLDAGHMLQPNETFFSWSDEAWSYALLHRRPPGPMLWRQHAITGPLAGWLTQKTLANLQKNPPDLFISWQSPEPPDNPIVLWAMQNYDALPDPHRAHFPLQFFVRHNSDLQHRLLPNIGTRAS